MSQYKNHPIVEALNVIAPLIVPSFELVSLRDDNDQTYKKPVFTYIIASIINKALDRSTNKWRTTYSVLLSLDVFETKKPLAWCEYKELEDAQNRQALFKKLESLLQDVIVMFVDPKRINPQIDNGDTIYSKYNFLFEGFRDGLYYTMKGKQNMTGVALEFNLSCFTQDENICCVDDGSKEVAKKIQDIMKENSISYQQMQKRIDA